MGVFAKTDLFEIQVQYVLVKSKGGVETIKILDETTERGKEEIEDLGDRALTLHTYWISPNWKQSNDLLRRCMKYDPESGKRELDWALYRAQLIESFMRKWDATDTDEDGNEQPVPCNRGNVERLDAQIAVALVDKFLERTTVTEDDLGN
jgi:hypothetical protein